MEWVKCLVSSLENSAPKFESVFGKKLDIEFINLSYVEDSSNEVCLWHKDGYFFDGQFHLTVLGNSQIEVVTANGENLLLSKVNGTVWYLNGSSYYHKVKSGSGPRVEILVPQSPISSLREMRKRCISNTKEMYLNPFREEWKISRQRAINKIEESVHQGKASNLQIADFPTKFDYLVEQDWMQKLGLSFEKFKEI